MEDTESGTVYYTNKHTGESQWENVYTHERIDEPPEFRAEREEMLEELRDLEKHLKLDDTIIQHFVPAEAVEMIQKRATWDEQLGEGGFSFVYLANDESFTGGNVDSGIGNGGGGRRQGEGRLCCKQSLVFSPLFCFMDATDLMQLKNLRKNYKVMLLL